MRPPISFIFYLEWVIAGTLTTQICADITSTIEDLSARFAFPDLSPSQTPSLSLKGTATRTWFGAPFLGRDKWAGLQCKLSRISLTNGQIVDVTQGCQISHFWRAKYFYWSTSYIYLQARNVPKAQYLYVYLYLLFIQYL